MGDDLTTSRVAEPVLFRGELAQILHCARHPMIKTTKYDSAGPFQVDLEVELHRENGASDEGGLEATSYLWISVMMNEYLTG